MRSIPVIVRITDINDNAPVFTGLPYAITVPEVGASTAVAGGAVHLGYILVWVQDDFGVYIYIDIFTLELLISLPSVLVSLH